MGSFAALLFAILAAPATGSQGAKESETLALWLFDERDYPHTTLTDASARAKADLRLMKAGRMVPGKYGNALQIRGPGDAAGYAGFSGKVPEEELREEDGVPSGLWGPTEGPGALLKGLAGKTWTVEFWLKLSSPADRFWVIDLGQAYEPGFSIRFDKSSFVVDNYYAGLRATCPTRRFSKGWHHVAVTRNGSTVRCFLDGVVQPSPKTSSMAARPLPDLQKPEDREHEGRGFDDMKPGERKRNRFNLSLGADRRAADPMKGLLDEMRLSGVVRYKGKFSPQSHSRNFGPGAPKPAVPNGPPLLFDPKAVASPLPFGARKHVFVDDAILERTANLAITLNRPTGKKKLDLDFRIKKSAWRPSVFDVGKTIMMAIPESYSSEEGITVLATSSDGLAFRERGMILPEIPHYGAFFRDLNPTVPAAERYKVNSFVANRGMYLFTSPDGVNWRRNETIQLPLRSGGGGECFWDDQRGKYVSIIKRDSSFRTKKHPGKGPKGHKAIVFETNEVLKPWPFKALKQPYFEGWPFPAVTGEGPILFRAEKYGSVYRTRAIKYPWAPDVYLAFIWRYPGDDGARHVELAVSRNGRAWTLFGKNWYLPTGAAEEELMMYGMIRRGDEIWQYVNEGGAHGGDKRRRYYRYKQRLDGFVSLDAGATPGEATTRPLTFKGKQLLLNVNVREGGSAKVAITTPAGRSFPGFGIQECDEVKSDSTAHRLTWKANGDVSALEGKAVRLKFQARNAKLYSFEFK